MTWTPDMPDRRSASDMVSWKSYVDKVFDEHRFQVQAALEAHDSRLQMNHEGLNQRLVAFQEQLNRRIAEQHHATDIQERERAKAAEALRDSETRSTDIAEREREKAAQALATTLNLSIHEGDERLREHIHNQVEQINAALGSVEGRAILRSDAVTNRQSAQDERVKVLAGAVAEGELRADVLSRERMAAMNLAIKIASEAQASAVAKAEHAAEKRFASVNEFRSQLADQVATFLPREVAETQINELRKTLSAIHSRLDTMQGHNSGEVAQRDQQQISVGQMVGIISLVIALAAIAVGAFT